MLLSGKVLIFFIQQYCVCICKYLFEEAVIYEKVIYKIFLSRL